MSEPVDSKKLSNSPSCQKPGSTSAPLTETDPETESSFRAQIIEQGRKFLESDQIKAADTSKKISFLESKGLSSKEIDGIIQKSDAAPTATDASLQRFKKTNTPLETKYTSIKTVSQTPIITYPEFLTNLHQARGPILTTASLLSTIYICSLLIATLYGTHSYAKFLLNKLGECRHDFFSTALSKLDNLSLKLEGAVSEIPSGVKKANNLCLQAGEDEKFAEEPTELFHRDIGIQTSFPSSDNSFGPTKAPQPSQNLMTHQTSHLAAIHASLREFTGTLADETTSDVELKGGISELRTYLHTLAFPIPPINSYLSMNRVNGPSTNGETDEVTEIKKGIKGMKGLLLSARTFPGVKYGNSSR